jgi:predicted dehydrogenase
MKNEHPAHPSRRQLLASGAAVAGALAIGKDALAAQGQDDIKRLIPKCPEKRPIPEGTPIRVAVIGCGGMGRGHLGSMLSQIENKHEHFEVVACCDVNKVNLQKAVDEARSRQSGVEVASYQYHEELLARDDIDAVLIAAPEHWHAQLSIDALAAGKDVYCEKPMTLSIEEALWMVDTLAKNPHMRLQVGTQYMMREKFEVAKRLIAEGKIGHPTLSQTSYCRNTPDGEWNYYGIDEKVQPGTTLDWERWCGPEGEAAWDTKVYHRWRRYKRWSTGIIGDLLVHQMTPLMYALDRGWPTRVTGSGGHYLDKEMENHDQVILNVEFEKDHTMIVAGSSVNATGFDELIRGNKANLYLASGDCDLRPEGPYTDDIDPQKFPCERIDEQPALRLDWLKCVRTREQNKSQVDLAAKVMVIVDLATRSMWDGGTWLFDPALRKATRA